MEVAAWGPVRGWLGPTVLPKVLSTFDRYEAIAPAVAQKKAIDTCITRIVPDPLSSHSSC